MSIARTTYGAPCQLKWAVGSGILLGAAGVIWAFGNDWRWKVAISAGAGLTGLALGYRVYKRSGRLHEHQLRAHVYLQPDEDAPNHLIKPGYALGGGVILSAIALIWAFGIDRRLQIGLTVAGGLGGLGVIWYAKRGIRIQPHASSFQEATLHWLKEHNAVHQAGSHILMVSKPFLGDGPVEAHLTMAGWAVSLANQEDPGPLRICQSLGAFTRALSAFGGEQGDGKRAFMVPTYNGLFCVAHPCARADHVTVHDMHKVAVLAERRGGRLTITVLDGQGCVSWNDGLGSCLGKVRQALQLAALPADTRYRISIHKLQGRWTGCDMHAMHAMSRFVQPDAQLQLDQAQMDPQSHAGTLADPHVITRLPISWCELEQSREAGQRLGGQWVIRDGGLYCFNKRLEESLLRIQDNVIGAMRKPEAMAAALRNHLEV